MDGFGGMSGMLSMMMGAGGGGFVLPLFSCDSLSLFFIYYIYVTTSEMRFSLILLFTVVVVGASFKFDETVDYDFLNCNQNQWSQNK